MRKNILFLLFMYSLNMWGQRFDIVRAVYQNEEVPSKGEIFVDVTNASIEFKVNGQEMTLQKMTFKKGEAGQLLCYKENIDTKKRVIFSPNKTLSDSLRRVTHIMTYTIVQPFSNQKTEVIYHLTKQRSRRKP